jgi:superfamily II DNA or RNA helicase
VLSHAGVKAAAIHSELTRPQRTERLTHLKIGRLKALVAPTILNEGLDVPDVDLGIVMGGSKSRRQMIQRMGRVLRWKSDGRSATFVVVYAIDTHEDLTQTTGQEGCLDLILATASSIENLEDGAPKRAAQQVLTACPVERDDALPVQTVPDLAEPDLTVPVQMASVEASPVAASLTPSGPGEAAQALVAHIERLAALRERDLLTDAEFTAAKARVLYG